jgi:hypothetical protein
MRYVTLLSPQSAETGVSAGVYACGPVDGCSYELYVQNRKGTAQNSYTGSLLQRSDFLGSRRTLIFDMYLLRISAGFRLR